MRALRKRDTYTYTGSIAWREAEENVMQFVDGRLVANAPRVLEQSNHPGSATAEVAIYQNEAVTHLNGRIPERAVAIFAVKAFDRAGVNARVHYNYPAQPDPYDKAVCADDSSFVWWRPQVNDGVIPKVARDSNVLICSTGSGGCGAICGNVATTSGARITEVPDHTWTGEGSLYRNIFSNLHEIGHNLCARHDAIDDVEGIKETQGNNHYGMGWNQDGRWHRTPTVAGNGVYNACGTWIEERLYDREVKHLYFHDCLVSNWNL